MLKPKLNIALPDAGLPVPRLRRLRLPAGDAVPRRLLGPDRAAHGRHPPPLPQVPHAALAEGPTRRTQHEHPQSAEHQVSLGVQIIVGFLYFSTFNF